MRRTFSLMVCLIALTSVSTFAHQSARAATPAPQAAQATAPTPPAAKAADMGIDTTDANITIEITVVDKAAGATATTTRLGSITVANQSRGSVRGLGSNYNNSAARLDPVGLDIDAQTSLRKSGMVSAYLTVVYIPMGADPVAGSKQQQSATIFLKPGQETQLLTTGAMNGQGPAVRITAKATVVK